MDSIWVIGTIIGIAFAVVVLELADKNDDDPLNHPDQVFFSYFRKLGAKGGNGVRRRLV
jgi:hypothetical protein